MGNIEWPSISFFSLDISIFEVTVSILGLILMWLAARYARKAYQIMKISNKIKDKKIELSLYDYPLDNDFVILAPFEAGGSNEGNLFQFPLDISVWNRGKISLEDAKLYLKISADLYRVDGIVRVASEFLSLHGVVTASEIIEGTKMLTVAWRLGDIPPNPAFPK